MNISTLIFQLTKMSRLHGDVEVKLGYGQGWAELDVPVAAHIVPRPPAASTEPQKAVILRAKE